MDLNLQDKVALLIGGSGSIGQAVAESLAAEGAVPVVADLPHRLADVRGPSVELDVTDEANVRQVMQNVYTGHGRIDILVHLAGIYQGKRIVDTTGEDWDRLMAVNLRGMFFACREVLPLMQASEYGRIICLASLAGQVGGLVAGANYAASKAGVLSLVKSLAKQTEKPWITVNAINPGPVVGDMTDTWPEEQRRAMAAQAPLGRFAEPREVAALITFVASPRAAYIHGAHLDINGGTYMD